jgi:hypothetical protein
MNGCSSISTMKHKYQGSNPSCEGGIVIELPPFSAAVKSRKRPVVIFCVAGPHTMLLFFLCL